MESGVEELVIGVPAHEEGETIVDMARSLERGSASLGEGIRCELVLAYQQGLDETLQRWESFPFRIRSNILYCPRGLTGKGRNVKALIDHARGVGGHLLLVDADFRSYPPANIGRFVSLERLSRGGMVLPLWCRSPGQGNSTDFFACPLIYAATGARVRQPLAGHMLLTKRMLDGIDIDSLPDDYGIDVALTIHALSQGLSVDQVLLPMPQHDGGGNSHRIMCDVAGAMLSRLANGSVRQRTDVTWPDHWWDGQLSQSTTPRSLLGLIAQMVPTNEIDEMTALFDCSPGEVEEFWCARLADAFHKARAGIELSTVVTDLVGPFLVHAEYRRRLEVGLPGAEAYVLSLGLRLAAVLP
jgi:hypothetical protein